MSGNIFNHEQQPVYSINANSFALVADSIKHSLTTKTTAQPPNQHFNMHSISFLATLVCVFSATIMAIPPGPKENVVEQWSHPIGDQSYRNAKDIGNDLLNSGFNHLGGCSQLYGSVLSSPLNSSQACVHNVTLCCTSNDQSKIPNIDNLCCPIDVFEI